MVLKSLTQSVSRSWLEFVVVCLFDDLDDILLGSADCVLDLSVSRLICNRVPNSNSVPFSEKPCVDNQLNV